MCAGRTCCVGMFAPDSVRLCSRRTHEGVAGVKRASLRLFDEHPWEIQYNNSSTGVRCGMRIVTGLDWSGDAGDPAKSPGQSLLVFAAVHVRDSDLDHLRMNLAMLRRRLRVEDEYVFKHSGSSDKTKAAFFQALTQLPVTITVLSIRKNGWDSSYLKRSTGIDRINDAIMELVCQLPDSLVDDQFLLIDLPRRELHTVKDLRVAVRRVLFGIGRGSFKNIRPRPDHRDETATIQIADMVAAEFRKQGGFVGPHLRLITPKVTVL
jgi:hypothetical protein